MISMCDFIVKTDDKANAIGDSNFIADRKVSEARYQLYSLNDFFVDEILDTI